MLWAYVTGALHCICVAESFQEYGGVTSIYVLYSSGSILYCALDTGGFIERLGISQIHHTLLSLFLAHAHHGSYLEIHKVLT